MTKLTITVGLICIASISSLAQQKITSTFHKASKIHTVDFSDNTIDYNPQLNRIDAPQPGGESYGAYLQLAKSRIEQQYPRNSKQPNKKAANVNLTPTQTQSFGGFRFLETSFLFDSSLINTGNPSDHALGISKDSLLLVGYNSAFWGIDLRADTLILNPNEHVADRTFGAFVQGSGIGLSFPFDPKIIYDPIEDRFIAVFLSGRTPSDSRIIVAFSETNHPGKTWNVYAIDGNPTNNNMWTDYPAIAITRDELFITVNLLRNGEPWQTGFAETIIWQVDKQTGYDGDSALTTRLWNNITFNGEPLRYFCPIQGGYEPTGPNMYFISNRSIPQLVDTIVLMNDSIFLIEVTGTLNDPNTDIIVRQGKANQRYGTPPNALQANDFRFNTNDSRVLGGFIQNGEIQFVGNTIDTTTGGSAFYHGFINTLNQDNFNVQLEIIGGEILNGEMLDIGYPNIAFGGKRPSDRSAIIGFNHSSPSNYAGNSCVFMNNSGLYSSHLVLKEGENYVNELGGRPERWGDYFGIQRHYAIPDTANPSAFLVGYYGLLNRTNSFWVSEVQLPLEFPVSTQPKANKPFENKPQLFPNPSNGGRINVEFNLFEGQELQFSIYDLSGKLVQVLNKDWVNAGKYHYSFNSISLAKGTYLLKIDAEKQQIATLKFIVD